MYDNALELYNEYKKIYFNQYMALSDAINLFLKTYHHDVCFENEK